MNDSEAMQLMLVGHMTITTWRTKYVRISIVPPIFILYRTYFFNDRKVSSISNIVPTRYAILHALHEDGIIFE